MKPLYMVLIGLAVLVIVFLIYRSNKNRQEAARAATEEAIKAQNQSGSLPLGGSSQVAQIINSLFPYFQTATKEGLIGDKK